MGERGRDHIRGRQAGSGPRPCAGPGAERRPARRSGGHRHRHRALLESGRRRRHLRARTQSRRPGGPVHLRRPAPPRRRPRCRARRRATASARRSTAAPGRPRCRSATRSAAAGACSCARAGSQPGAVVARPDQRRLPDRPHRRHGPHRTRSASSSRWARRPRGSTSTSTSRLRAWRATSRPTRRPGSGRCCWPPSTAACPRRPRRRTSRRGPPRTGRAASFWQGKSYPTSVDAERDRARQRDELQLPVVRQLDGHLRRPRPGLRAACARRRGRDHRREPERGPAGDRRQRRQSELVDDEHAEGGPEPRGPRQRLDDPSLRAELGAAHRLDDQLGEGRLAPATCRSGSPSGASRPTTAAACRTTTASTSA